MKEDKVNINISVYEILLGIGIIIIAFGGLIIWFDCEGPSELLGIDCGYAPLIIGLGFWIICGYITYKILPEKKAYTFVIGFVLGIIGVIIAIFLRMNNKTKSESNGNKYEELQKLSELKQRGTLTEKEFKEEKAKILK